MNRISLRYCLSLPAHIRGVNGGISVVKFYLPSCSLSSSSSIAGLRGSSRALPFLATTACRRNLHHSPLFFEGVKGIEGSEPDQTKNLGKFGQILQRILSPSLHSTCGIRMYSCCVDAVDYDYFFETLNMPDTFHSWFLILHLHVWMCLVRLKHEEHGRDVYYVMVQTMWKDVQERAKLLGSSDPSTRNSSIRELYDQFNGLTVAYDVGLVSDDHVLAAALWRNLVRNKDNVDIVAVEKMVHYVRRQIHYLEQIDSEKLLKSGILHWGSPRHFLEAGKKDLLDMASEDA